MSFALTDQEWSLLEHVPIQHLVDLAADLDMVPPAEIDRRALVDEAVPRMVARFEAEGIPLSKYDRDDLEGLTSEQLQAIGRLQGIRGQPSIVAILKVGRSVYKSYAKNRPDNAVAMMVPTLLTAVARAAART